MPAFRTLDSVLAAVSNMRGKMLAFTTADRVRTVKPYNFVIS
jgi:hypothetical protein